MSVDVSGKNVSLIIATKPPKDRSTKRAMTLQITRERACFSFSASPNENITWLKFQTKNNNTRNIGVPSMMISVSLLMSSARFAGMG